MSEDTEEFNVDIISNEITDFEIDALFQDNELEELGWKKELNSTNQVNKIKNAQASKKWRMKRRREKDELKKRNQNLEAEQELFLSEIAFLELQYETLRSSNASCLDLEKENALLKRSIKRHKLFVDQILNVISNSEKVSLEDQTRLLQSGVDSSIDQVIGLAYLSGGEQTMWFEAETLEFDQQIYAHIRYQFSPTGCAIEDAKRINVRIDHVNPNFNQGVVLERVKKLYFDSHFHTEVHKNLDFPKGVQVEVETIFPKLFQEIKQEKLCHENIEMFRIKKKKQDSCTESIYAASFRDIDNLFPQAFRFPNPLDKPCPATVIMSGTSELTNTQLLAEAEISEGFSRVQNPWTHGQIVTETGCITVASYPLNQNVTHPSKYVHGEPLISKDGKLRKDYKETLMGQITFLHHGYDEEMNNNG